MDSEALFTDMVFELLLAKYKDHNMVIHGYPDLLCNDKSWIALNTTSFSLFCLGIAAGGSWICFMFGRLWADDEVEYFYPLLLSSYLSFYLFTWTLNMISYIVKKEI